MPELKPFTVPAKAMHELVIMPQFGDILNEDGSVLTPSPEEGDWSIIDNVVHSRPIIDLFGSQNILKRRDATCKLIYSPVSRLGARYITTDPLYAAVEDCQEEYYQGSFADYTQQDFQAMFSQIMPIMEKGVAADLFSNKYFGDVTRVADPNGIWSWNKFDGVFTHIAKYIANGTIPASQTFSIGGGAITGANANAALNAAITNQDPIMRFMPKEQKAFYVDEDIADAYFEYLKSTGETPYRDLMTGRPKLFKNGIELRVKPWDSILASLNAGVAAHAVILTLKGNFLFGTDSKYGGGRNRDEAIRIWWSDDDEVWRRQMHVKAGTEIVAPQFITIGMTAI